MVNETYPLHVEINEQNILALTDTFKKTYKQIVKQLENATSFGTYNRKVLLAQIEDILTELGENVDEFLKKELPEYYKTGANQAVKQLRNIKADVKVATGFNRIHKEAILALIDETSKAFGESLTGVNRSAQLLLGKINRELLTQKMAEGQITGEALKQVKQTLKGILQEQGLTALIDKAGRKWELDRYTEMLFRTKAVEARNRGLVNRMVENDYDLVQVSAHPGTCPICEPWQGKILSISGAKGYQSVAEAEQAGLFHPNCRHAINVLIPSLARKTQAYDTEE